MVDLARARDGSLIPGGGKVNFSDVVCRVVYMCKRRWLRNRRRSFRLWSTAFSRLAPDLQPYLSFTADDLRDPSAQVFGLLSKSISSEKSKAWKIKRSTGETVALRTVLSGVISWLDRFKQVGSNVVQYDPVHSALPWAAVCFCLDIALSDVQNYNAYIDGLEQVSKFTAEYAEHQNTLLRGSSNLKKQLEAAIITLYLAILTYLAEARRYLEASTGRRLVRNVAHGGPPKAVELLAAIEKHQIHAARLVTAVQHEISYRKLTDIERSVQGLETLLRSSVSRISEVRASILRRLGACFTNDPFDAALAKCQPSTASWIFDRDVYRKWSDLSDPTSKFLWVYGPPGAGKTILSANIIRSLKGDQSRNVSYFYCVHEDDTRRNPNAIVRTCLAQLIEQVDLATYVAYQLVGSVTHRPLTDSEVWLCFNKVCKQVPHCTIVIDGFDECLIEGSTSRSFEDDAKSVFLRTLINELSSTQAYVLLISRDDADIRTEISGGSPRNVVISQYSIQKVDQQQDVQTVTQQLINEKLSDRPEMIREEITRNAIDKSDGMMLWIHLLAKELRPRANAKALRRIVTEMPAGIEQAYERDLARISLLNGHDKAQATYILRWLLFSSRPMTIGEIIEALIMINVEEDNEYPADELPDAWIDGNISEDFVNDLFRRMLGSLIDIRSSSDSEPVLSHTVHFVHFSVKEYLLTSDTRGNLSVLDLGDSGEENTRLASICLRYLCLDVFGVVADPDIAIEETFVPDKYPFLLYAASNWHHHATHQNPVASELVALIEELISPKTANWLTWSRIFEPTLHAPTLLPPLEVDQDLRKVMDENDKAWFTLANVMKAAELESTDLNTEQSKDAQKKKIDNDSQMLPRPMYYLGLLGILDLVKTMWSQSCDIQQHPGKLGNLLHAAAYQGHEEVVTYMIEQGVDIQQKAGPFSYAIIAAAAAGLDKMVQLLLSHGAEVNCSDDHGNRAIHYAAVDNRVEALRILIRNGADLNLTNEDGVTALHFAAYDGWPYITLELLEAGADVRVVAPGLWFTSTALHVSISRGYEYITKILILYGADVHQVTDIGANCLHLATHSSTKSMLDTILATDVQIDQRDHAGLTAVHYAAMNDDEDMIVKLLDRGIEVDASSVDDATALCIAICTSSKNAAATLLERGADPNHTFWSGFTPLTFASKEADSDVVKLLIQRGADIEKTVRGGSPLRIALIRGHAKVIRTLIESGANVDIWEPSEPSICLELAAARATDSLEITKLLLENRAGANANPPSSHYTRALTVTIQYGPRDSDVELIQLLLDHGADPFRVEPKVYDTSRRLRRSPLDLAITNSNQSAVCCIILHRSVCRKFLPVLSNDIGTIISLLDAVLTNDLQILRAALSPIHVSNREALLSQLLIVAVISNASEVIDYLLDQGASACYESHHKRTVLHYAALRGDERLVKRLVQLGGPVKTLDCDTRSPLDHALYLGLPRRPVVEFLLRKEAEMNFDNKSCSPALIQYWRDNVHYLRGSRTSDTGETYPVTPFEINPWPDLPDDDILNRPPKFTGVREGELPLRLFGFLHGDDGVTWYHLVPTLGSVMNGKIDFAARKIVTSMRHDVLAEMGSVDLHFETRKEKKEGLARAEEDKKRGEEKKVVLLPGKE